VRPSFVMALRINIPPLTRALLVFLTGFSMIYQAASYKSSQAPQNQPDASISTFASNPVPWIALTPQLSMFYPWVYVTSSLAEQNLLTMAIAGATIFYGGKYLERAWGSRDFGIFMLVVTAIPNVVAGLLYVFAFAVTKSDSTA
jgi:membrane associated rhomboid family serine protease